MKVDDTKGTPSMVLSGQHLTLAYEQKVISQDLSVDIPQGKVTVIIGPNACGKSTLLKALSRILTPQQGQVILDGKAITEYSAKELAKYLGLLPQSSIAPSGITVSDLVSRGRFPHQGLLKKWSQQDEDAVQQALRQTQLLELADRYVDELSGGQRQRVWLALVLAQQTDLLMLDEPTTYLDIAHQLEVLDLCRQLNRTHQKTIVMVLHDLNLAARYADYMIAMKDGKIVGADQPDELIQPTLLKTVFGIDSNVIQDPVTGTPLVVPISESYHS